MRVIAKVAQRLNEMFGQAERRRFRDCRGVSEHDLEPRSDSLHQVIAIGYDLVGSLQQELLNALECVDADVGIIVLDRVDRFSDARVFVLEGSTIAVALNARRCH